MWLSCLSVRAESRGWTVKGASGEGGGHGRPPRARTFSGGNEFEGLSESL